MFAIHSNPFVYVVFSTMNTIGKVLCHVMARFPPVLKGTGEPQKSLSTPMLYIKMVDLYIPKMTSSNDNLKLIALHCSPFTGETQFYFLWCRLVTKKGGEAQRS
jgi:hypothetical protein